MEHETAMPDAIAQFAQAKYLSLAFRKTGMGVRTPVWFAEDAGEHEKAAGRCSTCTPRRMRAS